MAGRKTPQRIPKRDKLLLSKGDRKTLSKQHAIRKRKRGGGKGEEKSLRTSSSLWGLTPTFPEMESQKDTTTVARP